MKETKKKILWSVVLLALIGITLYVIVKATIPLLLRDLFNMCLRLKNSG